MSKYKCCKEVKDRCPKDKFIKDPVSKKEIIDKVLEILEETYITTHCSDKTMCKLINEIKKLGANND